MNCHHCKRKIPRQGYKWCDKIYCSKCFTSERGKQANNPDVEWHYELVDAKQDDKTKQLTLLC